LLLSAAFIGGSETNPESVLPPTTLGALNESESPEAADGCTVNTTLCDDVPAFAVMTEHPATPLAARTVNEPLEPESPFDVVTDAGTVAMDGMLLVKETSATQLLHNPLTVTVPAELLPAVTEAGVSLTVATSAALMVTTAASGAATSNRRTVAGTHVLVWARVSPVLPNMIRLRAMFYTNEANRALFSHVRRIVRLAR
jgi:hypothetical protein